MAPAPTTSTAATDSTRSTIWIRRAATASCGTAFIVGSQYDDKIEVNDIWGESIFDDPIVHGAHGGPGDDELWGFEVDHLFGGPGDDRLIMHKGGTAEGGPGADTFRYFGEVESAVIKDFSPDEGDLIDLSSWTGFLGVFESDIRRMLNGSTGNELDLGLLNVVGEDHGTITLEGVDVSTLTVSDFIFD